MALSTEESGFGLVELLIELRDVRDRLVGLENELRGRIAELDSRIAMVSGLENEISEALNGSRASLDEINRCLLQARQAAMEAEQAIGPVREELARRAAALEAEMKGRLEAVIASCEESVASFAEQHGAALERASSALEETLSGIRATWQDVLEGFQVKLRELEGRLRGEVEETFNALRKQYESWLRVRERDLCAYIEKCAGDLREDVSRRMEQVESRAADLQQVRGEMEGLRAATLQRTRAMEEKADEASRQVARVRGWVVAAVLFSVLSVLASGAVLLR